MKTQSAITSISPAIFCAVKIFCTSCLSVLSFSCTNYIYDSNVSPVTEPDSSVSDIVESVYGLWDELYGSSATKSGMKKPKVGEIRHIGCPYSKGDGGEEYDDAFVINFSQGGGFAVVRDGDGQKIVALSDNGNITPQKIFDDSDSLCSHYALYSTIRSALRTRSVSDTVHANLGIYNYLSYDPDSLHVTTGEWMLNDYYDPLVLVKWGQSYPFNTHKPIADTAYTHYYNNKYRNHYAVGCGPLAMAQVMVTTGHPAYFVGNISSYPLASFRQTANYNNYSHYLYYTYDSYADSSIRVTMGKIADMLQLIGERAEVYYTDNGTYTSYSKIIPTLYSYDSSYYKNGDVRDPFDELDCETAIPLLLSIGEPMIIYGSSHIWVLDGLFDIHRHLSNNQIERVKLYHFNWGWNGYCDGYYFADDFCLADRVFRDDIDTNSSGYYGTNDYTDNAKFIFFTVYHGN